MGTGLLSDKTSTMTLYIIITTVFIIIISTLWMFYNSRDWVETTGEVNFIEIVKVRNDTISSMSTNKGFTEYKINLEYTYSVDRKSYKGTQFYPLFPNVFSDKKDADELMDKYKSGQNTAVYYNPDSPHNSCLITSKNISPTKYVIMIAILVLFGTIFVTAFTYFNKIFD